MLRDVPNDVRAMALRMCDNLVARALEHMQTPEFRHILNKKGYPYMLNALLLFFTEKGRYKKCELFVGPKAGQSG